jgi:hypothetical protein
VRFFAGSFSILRDLQGRYNLRALSVSDYPHSLLTISAEESLRSWELGSVHIFLLFRQFICSAMPQRLHATPVGGKGGEAEEVCRSKLSLQESILKAMIARFLGIFDNCWMTGRKKCWATTQPHSGPRSIEGVIGPSKISLLRLSFDFQVFWRNTLHPLSPPQILNLLPQVILGRIQTPPNTRICSNPVSN